MLVSLDINNLMTLEQVASFHGVNRRAVHSWLQRGIAPRHIRIVDRTYFFRDAVESFRKPLRGKKPHDQ